MNNPDFPPKQPKMLSDEGNESINACVTTILDEARVDLSIIYNLVMIDAHNDTSQKLLERCYRQLQERIVNQQDGLRAVMANARDRIEGLRQSWTTSNDLNILSAIVQLSNALLQALVTHQHSVRLILETSMNFGLQELVSGDETWNERMIQSLRDSVALQQLTLDEQHVPPTNNGIQDVIGDMEAVCTQVDRFIRNLTAQHEAHVSLALHSSAANRLYFANNQLGNRQLLLDILHHCQQSNTTTVPDNNPRELTPAYIAGHCHLFAKHAFNIGRYMEAFNANQIRLASLVQKSVTRSWCRQMIRQLDEFKHMGRRRRSILASTIEKVINEDERLDRSRLAYLSEESIQGMETIITQTKERIRNSEIYLNDPNHHAYLYDNCFKPELDYIIKQQRLFNLVPKPSCVKKHIKVTNSVMNSVLRTPDLQNYRHGDETLTGILDLAKVKKRNNMIFSGYIMTDGFSVSVPYDKPVTGSQELPRLDPQDFEPWELEYLNVWGADPGVSSIYVASNGSSDDVYLERK